MAKRLTKTEAKGIATLIIIGSPVVLLITFAEAVGWSFLFVAVVVTIMMSLIFSSKNKEKRRKELMEKYQDEEIVNLLMSNSFWEGQTSQQLEESLGEPHGIDRKILKTKKKEVWKYNHQGGRRYRLRITLDDDVVVGWDKKS